jgi:predicted aconitase with swiveling domain
MVSDDYSVMVPGRADGLLVVLDEPLSLWGGFDPETGLVIDGNHPQAGETLSGHIVCMPHGRGSSSSSSVLAEALRAGTGPAGFVLGEPDPILVIGSLVANRLYQSSCPIIVGPIPKGANGRWEIDSDISPFLVKLGG